MKTIKGYNKMALPIKSSKFKIALGGLAVAAIAAACGSTSASTTTTAASSSSSSSSSGKITIAFNMGAEADPFFISMNLGASAEAKKLGVNLIWQGDPSVYSPATQIPIVNQLLALHPSALILSPTDPTALQASVDQATSMGIPVFNVDTHVADMSKVVSFITGDNTQGGQAAADAMAKAINYQSGKTYQVVVGMSSPTATTNTARLAGFEAELKAKYPGMQVVSTAYSQSQAAVANTNVNNWLTQYPNLAGIFAIDGTNASGASAALEAHNLVGKVALVGYDAYSTNVDLLSKGVFTALIAQDPAQEGAMSIDNAVKYLKQGKSAAGIQKQIILPNIVLTSQTSAADLAKYTYATA